MANTGLLIPLTLKEVHGPCPVPCTPTGNTKPDSEGDPDYIAPYIDTTLCPITYSDDCPVLVYSESTTSIEVEFSLDNSVVTNPNVKTIRTSLKQGATVISTYSYTLPNTPSPNFFTHTYSSLTPASSYDFLVEYLDASSAVYKTCPIVTMDTP